jgi:hypothetical protein
LRKKIRQFILYKILIPLLRLALKLEFRKYRKAKKLSRLTYLYLHYRLRNIFNFHDIGWSKKEDETIFFVISNLLEIEHSSEDNAFLEEIKDEVYLLQSEASNDYDVIVLIDIFAQLENILNDKLKRDNILEERQIPHDNHIVDINDLNRTEKKLKKFSNKNIDVVKDRTAFKISFTYSEVSSVITVIAPLIIISSYLFNKTFYSEFGVDVSRYFSISDHLSTSIEHIEKSIKSGIYAILGIVWSFDMYSRNFAYAKAQKSNRTRNGYIIFTTILFLTIYNYYIDSYIFYRILSILIYIIIVVVSDYIACRLFDNSTKALFFLIFSLLITSNSLIEGKAGAEYLKNNWDSGVYELRVKNEIESSISKPTVVIGQNSKYIFLSDTSFSKIIITDNSKIELYMQKVNDKQ